MSDTDMIGLVNSISKDLNIIQDQKESYKEWIKRIVYSATGRMMLASLWDNPDDVTVTVQHIKATCIKVADSYKECFPELKDEYSFASSKYLADRLECWYRDEGFYYHKDYEVQSAERSYCQFGSTSFIKGIYATEHCSVSGAGIYTLGQEIGEETDYFTIDGSDLLNNVIENAKWYKSDLEGSAKFLRTRPPFNKGYWTDKCDRQSDISMVMDGDLIHHYHLCKYGTNGLEVADLPDWIERDRQFTYLSIALLRRYGTLPTIKAVFSDQLVDLHIGYRLPPKEENTFKLYSWPIYYGDETIDDSFHRQISVEIYEGMKTIFTNVGYNVEENR